MPISAIIVDDEKLAREELAFLLQSFPEVTVVAQGQNGLEAVKLVKQLQPDLLFLDAQMPGLDGFAAVRMMEQKRIPLPVLVFATAFDQYALQAFEVNAVDYLLKPFDQGRLAKTMEKVRRNLQAPPGATDATATDATATAIATDAIATAIATKMTSKIDRVLEMLDARKAPDTTKVLIKSGGRQYLLNPQEIVFARIEGGAITVATRQMEGQATYRTIEELQATLDAAVFWRAHRSYLVNLNHVREVVPWFNSSYQLKMDDKKQSDIPVSRAQSRQLRELYKL